VKSKDGNVPVLNGLDAVYHRPDRWQDLQEMLVVSATYSGAYDGSEGVREDIMDAFKKGRMNRSHGDLTSTAVTPLPVNRPYSKYPAYVTENVYQPNAFDDLAEDRVTPLTGTAILTRNNSSRYELNKTTVGARITFAPTAADGTNERSRTKTIQIGVRGYTVDNP